MTVETSDVPGRLLATSGIWEPHVTAAFTHLLSPGDVCVDAGAHIGYFALLASRLVGASGHVYALEPAPETYEKLCANLELNAARNVTALCLGAGAEDGFELLYPAPAGNTGSAAFRHQWGVGADDHVAAPRTVPVRAISSILERAELPRLRLVKIDVEGYELYALHGLVGIFEAGYRPALIVEVHGRVAHGAGAWLAELGREHAMTTYKLVAGASADRSVPRAIPIVPISDAELRSLDDEFVELVVSPDRLATRS